MAHHASLQIRVGLVPVCSEIECVALVIVLKLADVVVHGRADHWSEVRSGCGGASAIRRFPALTPAVGVLPYPQMLVRGGDAVVISCRPSRCC